MLEVMGGLPAVLEIMGGGGVTCCVRGHEGLPAVLVMGGYLLC